ncbi:MAG: EF2563 family selenium-dependent molybdenum hydroxylase system protein [Anaerolineae bacterium]|jgi:xanthine dehydrogenase accessory factor|nr:EF2563 family selenium-dependent molybdenum hydroxylase system protein [Anaerolineae bacterium]MBT7071548.1 EF2563 family selenium-dependent molybdenum hydroxylase system protein [Anaerolineae bacterium]MBT7326791.1 EF2563 family selenium-dependent molybdenum hydroxylase system protein [Anaerolineae bacterium]
MPSIILIRGGGDLATGVAYRLHKAGLKVIIAELPQPLSVRRKVSFSEAVYDGETIVEGVTGKLATPEAILSILDEGAVPVLVDPSLKILNTDLPITVLVDATLRKRPPEKLAPVKLSIGLGPGFTAAKDVDAVIETHRGHTLGRIYWQGSALADTGIPEQVLGIRNERVLRAPADGELIAHGDIGDHFDTGDTICEVDGIPLKAPFNGSLRGLLRPGLNVKKGLKIGDLDPREDPRYCTLISDKALSLGGSVLEAILSQKEIRKELWN